MTASARTFKREVRPGLSGARLASTLLAAPAHAWPHVSPWRVAP